MKSATVAVNTIWSRIEVADNVISSEDMRPFVNMSVYICGLPAVFEKIVISHLCNPLDGRSI